MELGLLFLLLLYKAQKSLFAPAVPTAPGGLVPPELPAAPKPSPTIAPTPQQTARTPVPWPMALPGDLPPFPAGWAPASPVTSAMVSRAFQLLPQLWAHGEGTWKPEKTGPRWVVYQARMTRAPDGTNKTGVVVFTAPSQAMPTFSSQPTVTPGAALDTMPAAHVLPTLRQGSKGPSVVWLQQQLRIDADGSFGPGTRAAVVAFQLSHGLTGDGVVGHDTWALLGSPAQAA